MRRFAIPHSMTLGVASTIALTTVFSVAPSNAQENRNLSTVLTSQIQITAGRTETGTVTGSQSFTDGDAISINVTGFNTNALGQSLYPTPVMGRSYCGFSNTADYSFTLTTSAASQPFNGGTYSTLTINDGVLLASINDCSSSVASTSLGGDKKPYSYSYSNSSTGASGTFQTGLKNWYASTAAFNNNKTEVAQNLSVAFFPNDSGFITGYESLKDAKASLSSAFAEQQINSIRDGVLIVNSSYENNSTASGKALPLADGSGYNLQLVNHLKENVSDDALVSYAFLPYGTEGLAAGVVLTCESNMWTGGNITESFAISSTENFSITRTAKGTYSLKFNDESGFSSLDGSLFVTGFATKAYGTYESFNGWYANTEQNGNGFKCWFTTTPNDDGSFTIKSYEYTQNQSASLIPVDANFSFAFISNDGLGQAAFSNTYCPGFNPAVKGSEDYAGGMLTFDYAGNANNYSCLSNKTSTAQYLKLDTLCQNGDFWIAINGNRLGSNGVDDSNGMLNEGVLLATIAQNGTKSIAKVDPANWRGLVSIDNAITGAEANINFSTAYFPKSGPWTVGRTDNANATSLWGNIDDFTITKTGTGAYALTIDGANPNDGVLLAVGRSNDSRSLVVATPNDDGWTLNTFNTQNASLFDDVRGLSFVYLPSDLGHISGTVLADGSVENAPLQNLFVVEDLGVGRWAIVPDASIDVNDYFLLLTDADAENPAYLSYQPEFDANGDVSRFLVEAFSLGNESALVDSAFNFALMSSYGFTHESTVPEPSTLVLLISGAALWSLTRFRKRNQA